MDRISVFVNRWMGLCRKPPVVFISPACIDKPPEYTHDGRPDGGAGGSGTIRRGISAALSGAKTLIRNPRLLWFSFFTGLVLAGHFIALWVLYFHPYSTQWPFYVDSSLAYVLASLVLTFAVEFPTVFCLVFLLAGLFLSLSPEKGGPVSFFQGLAGAQKYIRSLAAGSAIVALAGTLLFIAGQHSSLLPAGFPLTTAIPAFWSALWESVYHVLDQSPFNYVFYYPYLYAPDLPPYAGWGIQWVFKSALTQTLILSAINLFLFVLTLFVVPILVLERKSLKEAVSGSFALMRKIWGEVTACLLGLGIVVFAASLTYLLFQVATGILSLDLTWRMGDEWIYAGSLYILALSGFAFIVATVGGIATLELYTFAKNGHAPGSAGTEPPA